MLAPDVRTGSIFRISLLGEARAGEAARTASRRRPTPHRLARHCMSSPHSQPARPPCAAGRVPVSTSRRRYARGRKRHALTLEQLEDRSLLAVGGGFTAAGILGEYFNNASLQGNASFARQDVRIDFDWGAALRPGGSTDPKYAAVGPDHFSVRWTGRLIPAFSETYTFKTASDEGVRLFLKPASASSWTTVIDAWT